MSLSKEERILQNKLKELENRDFVPKAILDIVTRVMDLQNKALREWPEPSLPADRLASEEQRVQGAPLLFRAEFPVDRVRVRSLLEEMLDALHDLEGPVGEAVLEVRKDFQSKDLDLDRAIDEFLRGEDSMFQLYAQKTPDSPRTLTFLVQSSITPALMAAARLLQERLSESKSWMFGHCPACGSLPLISHLKGKEGFRFLTCSFCRTEYRAPRMTCPFCQEDRHDKRAYFDSEDLPGFVTETCATCKKYIKTVDFRQFDRKCVPVLDDLLSLPFDIIAREKGFSRPTLSAWGF